VKVRAHFADDDEIGDGETLTVPMMLMDAARAQRAVVFDARDHCPHHAELTDEVRKLRAKMRAEYLAGLQDAWRTPPHIDAAEPDNSSPAAVLRRHLRTEPDDDAQARRDRAWADYCDRVSNAWRTDPRAATAVERQRRTYTYEGGR
jgi:hypothetical protein